jgi:hypothetical protein
MAYLPAISCCLRRYRRRRSASTVRSEHLTALVGLHRTLSVTVVDVRPKHPARPSQFERQTVAEN